ncbi:GNAT domain - like 10 [Theobroma cacao]|nr:GNAT domain - like 10 [Theobroma cacao]
MYAYHTLGKDQYASTTVRSDSSRSSPSPVIGRCRANFGNGVAVKCWGHGIATKGVSQFFVDFPGVVRLEAFVHVDNKASQRVVEKAGFQKEGMLRKYVYLKGKLTDLHLFRFLSTDFPTAERRGPREHRPPTATNYDVHSPRKGDVRLMHLP